MCAIESSYPHDIYTPLGYQDTASFSTNMTDNSVTLTYKAETRYMFFLKKNGLRTVD